MAIFSCNAAQQNFLWPWKCFLSAVADMAATSHTGPLKRGWGDGATEFQISLHFNSFRLKYPLWLLATALASRAALQVEYPKLSCSSEMPSSPQSWGLSTCPGNRSCQPLPLRFSPWRHLVFHSTQSQILLRKALSSFSGLQMSSNSNLQRTCMWANMHATVRDAYFQIKKQFQMPDALAHVCQTQNRTNGAFLDLF